MRRNTPIVTLLAGAAPGVGLLIASIMATPAAQSPYAAAGLLQLTGPGRAQLTGSYQDHRATGRARANGTQYRLAISRVHRAGLHAAIASHGGGHRGGG
jgi:hypothetical protein